MIYSVLYDGSAIYDSRIDELRIRDTSLHIGVNEAGNFTFAVDFNHPAAGTFRKMKKVVEVLQDSEIIFRGRIISSTKNFDKSEVVNAEGVLAALNDSVIPPFSFPEDFDISESENVVETFFRWIIERHNEQSDFQFEVGNVTVADPNNYITRSNESYSTCWDTLSDKLFGSSIGGYICVRYEETATVIDYVDDFDFVNAQKVEYAGNLLDLVRESNGAELFSAILPIGADGMDIQDYSDTLPSGFVKSGNSIISTNLAEQYGRITRVIEYNDVTLVENLVSKAIEDLAAGGIKQTLTVNALDLRNIDGSSAPFRIARMCEIISAPHDTNLTLPLLAMDINLQDPSGTTITLAATETTATDFFKSQQRADRAKVNSSLQKNAKELRNLSESTNEQITQVLQSAEAIILTALDEYAKTATVEMLRETVSSQLEILKDQIELSFTTTTESIKTVNDDLQRQISDMTKYFRFTQDGLVIGESGNELTLQLDNDIIQFIRNNVPQLFIDENGVTGDVIRAGRMLRIGNYGWIAEPDGRISLRKVNA